MRFRAAGALVCVCLCALVAPAQANVLGDDPVYIDGLGGAHGYGLAMDGVEGEARAGWTHDRILDLFYSGTSSGNFGGTVRVWLAEGGAQAFFAPNGAIVLDAPPGTAPSRGFPLTVRKGGRITVTPVANGLRVEAEAARPAQPTPSPSPKAGSVKAAQATEQPQPTISPDPNAGSTPIPTVIPTPPPVSEKTPKPTARPTAPPAQAAPVATVAKSAVWIVPQGVPAITKVATTGHNYRGVIEARRANGGIRVVNHVDIETYVNGIAEEKGAGWPPEAMKVLAIAARSLAAATMTWYTNHHGEGYDICPSDKCQVYLGYDGEEPAMTYAASATAGVIRTFEGRPILAMYHGNGGGQTETYGPSHPYMKSVKYPYADPHRWRVETSFADMSEKLRAANIAVPEPLQRVKVVKRGVSPRVMTLELAGGRDEKVTLHGTEFASALKLPSTWFYFSQKKDRSVAVSASTIGRPPQGLESVIERTPAESGGFSWPLAVSAFLSFAVAAATTFVLRRAGPSGALTLFERPMWLRLRGDDASG